MSLWKKSKPPWRKFTQQWIRRVPFSKNLMQRRFDLCEREDTIARIVGVSVERYWLWEHGYAAPPQKYVRRIASALRIGPALLGPTRRRQLPAGFRPRHCDGHVSRGQSGLRVRRGRPGPCGHHHRREGGDQ